MNQLKMKPNEAKGVLITFDGLHGCGKTTLMMKLMEELLKKNFMVYYTKDPTEIEILLQQDVIVLYEDYIFSGFLVKPDIAFFCDVSAEKAVERVKSCEKENKQYIDMKLQQKLREVYLEICKAYEGVLVSTEFLIEESYKLVKAVVEEVIDICAYQ